MKILQKLTYNLPSRFTFLEIRKHFLDSSLLRPGHRAAGQDFYPKREESVHRPGGQRWVCNVHVSPWHEESCAPPGPGLGAVPLRDERQILRTAGRGLPIVGESAQVPGRGTENIGHIVIVVYVSEVNNIQIILHLLFNPVDCLNIFLISSYAIKDLQLRLSSFPRLFCTCSSIL